MTTKPDDLEAVRTIVATLTPFDASEQERILRWSREKLGLPTEGRSAALKTPLVSHHSEPPGTGTVFQAHDKATDIKSFIAEKAPSSDNQFAAAVAYYYRFEAPEAARKEAITSDDLREACRLAGRTRVPKPAQTLLNAHNGGLLDKTDRGAYAISTVGENLVAMALPSAGGHKARSGKKSTSKGRAKGTAGKKSGKQSKA